MGERVTSMLGIRHQNLFRHKPIPLLHSQTASLQTEIVPIPDTLMLCRALVYLDHLKISSRHRATHINIDISGISDKKLSIRFDAGEREHLETVQEKPIKQCRLLYFFTTRPRYNEFLRGAKVSLFF
jgi:hypothetical protein